MVTPIPDRPRRRGPRWLMVIGGVLTAVGSIAFVVGFVIMGATLFDAVDEGLNPTKHLDLVIDVPGRGTVDLESDRYQVVALGPSLTVVTGSASDATGQTVHRASFADPDVTVTGPSGDPVVLESPLISRVSRTPGLDAVGVYEFRAPVAGTYTVEVAGEQGPVTRIGVGEAKGLWEEASGWIASAVVITGGSVVATIGFTLLVIGFVWWLMDRARTAGPPGTPPGWGSLATPTAGPMPGPPPGPPPPPPPPPAGPVS